MGRRAEYDYGASFEMYSMEIPARYDGFKFSDIAVDIFLLHGALLIGVKCDAVRLRCAGRERYRRVAAGASEGYASARMLRLATSRRLTNDTREDATAAARGRTYAPEGGAGADAASPGTPAAGGGGRSAPSMDAAEEEDAVPVVLLNPGAAFVMRSGDHALVLATDIKDVDAIRVATGAVYRALGSRGVDVGASKEEARAGDGGSTGPQRPLRQRGTAEAAARKAEGAGTADVVEALQAPPARNLTKQRRESEAPGGSRRIRNAGARTGHIVVCGGATLHRLAETLRGIRSCPREAWRDVVVVAAVPVPACVYDYPFVYWITGDPLNHDVLRMAAVRTAHAVVVLMDRADMLCDINDKNATIATAEKYLADFDSVAAFASVRNFDTAAHVVCDLLHVVNGRLLNVRRHSTHHLAHGMYNSQRPVRGVARRTLPPPEELPEDATAGRRASQLRADPAGAANAPPAVGPAEETAARVAAAVLSAAVMWTGDDYAPSAPVEGSPFRRSLSAFRLGGTARVGVEATPGSESAAGATPASASEALAVALTAMTPAQRAGAARERRVRAQLAHEALSRSRIAMRFFETESFTAGAFFSRRMLRISLVQAYYNPFVITLMGVLLRSGPLYVPPRRGGAGPASFPDDDESDSEGERDKAESAGLDGEDGDVSAMVESVMAGEQGAWARASGRVREGGGR